MFTNTQNTNKTEVYKDIKNNPTTNPKKSSNASSLDIIKDTHYHPSNQLHITDPFSPPLYYPHYLQPYSPVRYL
jgi:hypothetical protein